MLYMILSGVRDNDVKYSGQRSILVLDTYRQAKKKLHRRRKKKVLSQRLKE